VSFGGARTAQLTTTSTNVLARLTVNGRAEFLLAEARRSLAIAQAEHVALQSQVDTARKDLPKAVERRQKSRETLRTAAETLAAKRSLTATATALRTAAELDVLRAERSGSAPQQKQAGERLEAARKALEGPTNELKQAENKNGSAEEEVRLAELGWVRATMAVSSAEWAVHQNTTRIQEAEQEAAHRQTEAREAESPVTAAWIKGPLLGTRHQDGSLRTWSLATGRFLDQFPISAGTPTSDETRGELPSLSVEWALTRTLGGETNLLFSDRINALAFRPDGLRLAAGGGEPSRGGDVHVFDPVTGSLRYAFTNLHSDSVLALAWSPDGRWLVSGGADRFARMVDTASARPDRVFEGHTGHVLAVAWSPDGHHLATGGAESALKLWDTATGEKRKQIQGGGKEFTGVGFLADDLVIGASGDPVVSVWKRSGESVRTYEGPTDFLQTLAVTPDGQTVVAGGLDGALRVWHGPGVKPAWTFAGQNGPVAEGTSTIPQVPGRK